MLRWANFAVRVIVIVLVISVLLLGSRSLSPAETAVEVAALAVAIIVLVVWVPTDRVVHARRLTAVHPYALAVMMVLCCVASATPSGGTFSLLVFIAAIAGGSDLELGAGLVVVGLGIATTIAAGLVLRDGTTVTAGYPLGLAFLFVLGRNLRAHRNSALQADRLREEQARAAALDERTRIAREIHDVLAHSLGALGVQIQAARAVLTDQHDEDRAVEILQQAQRTATEGLSEARRAVHTLRGGALPLPDGLAELGARHYERHGTRVAFDTSGEPRQLSPGALLALTRAAQEALVNSAKHAPRQPVRMRLDYTESEITLTVRNHLDADDNRERKPQLATANGGYGLAGMRERLLLLGGTLSAGPESDDWLVVATVPQ